MVLVIVTRMRTNHKQGNDPQGHVRNQGKGKHF